MSMNSEITRGLLCKHDHSTPFFHHSLNNNRRQETTGFGGKFQVNKGSVRFFAHHSRFRRRQVWGVRVYRLEMLSAPKELIIDLREGSVSECRPDLDAKRETVYMWIADKRMPAHEVGMPWKFRMSQVDAWRQAGNAGRNYALSRRRPNGLAVGGGMRR